MNIAIVGTGYVGLVSGTCFAETGNNVVCIDIDENKVLRMQNGEVPIYEPGLEVLFERNTKQGRLSFTTDLTEGIKNAEIIFLALPTPPGADGSADLKYVLKVAEHLSHIITDYKVIVDKSTVPVGTADKVYERLAANLDESFFDVVSNPEFLREGVAVDDFMRPERVVIGTSSSKAKKVMERLYNPFVRQGNPVIFMDEKSAEMTKYAANSFLATKITFMNEVANLCEEVGANVDMVRKGIGSDSRIGKRFLFPGVGYGGSCFPKDVKALAKTAQENNCDFRILQSVMDVNEDQKSILSRRIKNYFGESIANKTIGIWGLAFKPNTDDIREAPALTIIDELLKAGAQIKAFDPEAMENVKALMGDKIILCDNQYDAIEGTDALAVVTEWNVFRTPDYDRIMSSLREPVVFDGRNVFDPIDMKERGFVYSSIGRP
ncbi:MAG TPA: UDP-glucose 6-dehydrogenase [Saprospirales bacterium]|nr:UDP-glucose 6-dehydrogenase [Saprospirales bacterium]